MFKNEPLTDFTVEDNRNAFQAALDKLDKQIKSGTLYAKPIIQGEELKGEQIVDSIDPADPEIVIGKVHYASIQDAESTILALNKGASGWGATPFEKRVAIIKKAASIMKERKHEISALMVREAGKPWAEADGDTAEGIDFCEYYAEEMMRLGPPQKMGDVMGETNTYFYQPRGVGVVIAPWNFPFAIACGMTVAGLVTGNTIVLKPSEQTSIVGFTLAKILLEAGLPSDAFCFLPGLGEKIGAYMVDSEKVDMICFTGSKAVGLHIINSASEIKPGQRNVKKVVAEMGGKNACIIDEDADLDEAVKGVIHGAFGFAGQKCSATSRVIVVGDAYEAFMSRLAPAASDVIVGAPKDRASFLPPVIDQETYERLMQKVKQAEIDFTVVQKGEVPETGYFVPTLILKDVPTDSWIWMEELFGPIVACTKAKDFSQALEMANNSEYALTGGVYSRSPENLEKASREFKVGNLYINRKQTGALVYRQPFGGFKMSGIGSKAGGPDYLIQFMEPRTITENTMRKGFSPDVVAN